MTIFALSMMRYVKYVFKLLAVFAASYAVTHVLMYPIFGEWDFGTRSDIVTWSALAVVFVWGRVRRDFKSGRLVGRE